MTAGRKVGQCVIVEDPGDGVADGSHHLLHGTPSFLRIGAFTTLLVGGFTDAPDWGKGTIQDADYLSQRDAFGLFDEGIAPLHPSSAGDQSGSFKREQNLLQEFNRDVLPIGNVMALERGSPVCERQFK